MLSCKDVADRASALIDGELTTWETFRIRLHLAMCKGCRRFVAQMRTTDWLTARVTETAAPPRPDSGDPGHAQILSALRKRHPSG